MPTGTRHGECLCACRRGSGFYYGCSRGATRAEEFPSCTHEAVRLIFIFIISRAGLVWGSRGGVHATRSDRVRGRLTTFTVGYFDLLFLNDSMTGQRGHV